MTDEYYEWLDKYETLSENTCIKCGEKATHMTTGWIMPLCDECDEAGRKESWYLELRFNWNYKDYSIKAVPKIISILTENGNYEFKPCECGCSTPHSYQIEMDVTDVKEFKRTIK